MKPRHVAHDEPRGVYLRRFAILVVHPGIADVRIGEGDDLPAIRRIGEDLLIAGHGGVEHHLADRRALRADRAAVEHRAVREDEDGALSAGSHFPKPMRKAGKAPALPASLKVELYARGYLNPRTSFMS